MLQHEDPRSRPALTNSGLLGGGLILGVPKFYFGVEIYQLSKESGQRLENVNSHLVLVNGKLVVQKTWVFAMSYHCKN